MSLTKVTYSMIDGAPVNVLDFGATGDGVTDDTAAIQAAINSLVNGGKVYFPIGSYLVSSPIVTTYSNISLIGYNPDSNYNNGGNPVVAPTKIISSSTTGEVIRINKLGCSVLDITIDATTGRLAGANSTGYGIRVENIDSPTGSVANTTIANVHVVNQPSHGVLLIGSIMRVYNVYVDNCRGSGIVVDGGQITGRTNLLRPGQIDITNCALSRLGGHGIAIGNSLTNNATFPYRVFCHNLEIFFVRQNVSYPAYSVYCFGENITFDGCATDGQTSTGVIVHNGMYLIGFNILVSNHRFIACATKLAYIDVVSGFTSTNIQITDFYTTTITTIPDYDPAIYVHPNANAITVRYELTSSKIANIVNFENQSGLTVFYNETLINNKNTINGSYKFSQSQTIYGNAVTPWQQFSGLTTSNSTIGFSNWANLSATSANLNFFRSRSGIIGTQGAVTSGTDLASFVFCGDDGTNFITGAGIKSYVDGTPSTGVMPASIAFYTTPAGSGTLVNRLTIKETGATRFVPQTTPVTAQAGDVYYDSGTNKLRCYNGSIWNDLF